MKMLKSMLVMFVVMFALVGCSYDNVDTSVRKQQESRMQEAQSQAGLPAIKNFQEKKMMKMLYELRDQEDLTCYAYLFNERTGSVGQFLGTCLGYGLPASTQYSNPEKRLYHNSGSGTIPQAEPNGLFMPDGLSATWLMMVDKKTGTARPVYIEPLIIVSPFRLH